MSGIRKLALCGALGIAILGGGAMALASQNPSATGCSIDAMLREYGITGTTVASHAAFLSAATAQVKLEYPNAVIGDYRVASLRSADLPVVDGQVALLMRLDGATGAFSGSVGVQPQPARVTCAMSIYDASTGQFIATLKDLAVAN
jgi:hypothetical protein